TAVDVAARRAGADPPGGRAEAHHDEGDLEALEEDALEGDREADPVDPGRGHRRLLAERRDLARVDCLLVVLRLPPAGAEDRLRQPLEAVDDEEAADEEAQRTD